jgi:hypothetical protein
LLHTLIINIVLVSGSSLGDTSNDNVQPENAVQSDGAPNRDLEDAFQARKNPRALRFSSTSSGFEKESEG